MLCAFTVGFLETLLTLFCTVANLKISAMSVYDVATATLGTKSFQEKPLSCKEINTPTDTHTNTHAITSKISLVYHTFWHLF